MYNLIGLIRTLGTCSWKYEHERDDIELRAWFIISTSSVRADDVETIRILCVI